MADATTGITQETIALRKVPLDRPWRWLASGWEDMRANMGISLTYGVLAAITGYFLIWGLASLGYLYLVLPLAAGFLIMGPVLTVGLYEVSRRRQDGQSTTLSQALSAHQRNRSQIALMGVALLLMNFLWIRIAALIFMLYFGLQPPSFENLIVETFLVTENLPFLVFGTFTGAVLALFTYMISVISIPLLLDRTEANVIEAITTSWRSVTYNQRAMLLWAGLIVIFTAAGIATLFLGLIIVLPLIGHASWHAYKDLTDV